MTPKFKAITTSGQWVEEKSLIQGTIEGREFTQLECSDFDDYRQYEVIPETVCQFTGITDKNGKEIFKHDCLRNPKGEEGVVVWSNKRARFELKSENKKGEEIYIDLSQGFCNNKEITGNIHDHLLINETEMCECCGKKFPVSKMRMDEEDANWWCEECLNDMKQ